MAGGGGTRLWPLSRQKTPKQFLDLGSGQTLIQETFVRAKQLTDVENIYVASNENYQEQINEQLPEIKADHIFFEPEKRDTTAAFASVAIRLQNLGQGSVPTIFMWSDHVFTNEEAFVRDLGLIEDLLTKNPNHIVIVGHTPITPATSFGYMEVGDQVDSQENVYHLTAFKEKPDQATAEKFLAAGNYFWNLGYFSLRPDYMLGELQKQTPEATPALEAFTAAVASGDKTTINNAYGKFEKVSIEYTLIEKTDRIIAITGDYGWSDVGNWAMVKEIFGANGDHMPDGHHLHVNSDDNYIYNTTGKTVSLLGLKETIVVVTDDAILVTTPEHAPEVKDIVTRLEGDQKTDVL